MNGYTIMKNSYQKLQAEQGVDFTKEIRIYEFLETCNKEDINILVDSSAFNDIIRGYCELAIEQGSTRGIFDAMNAADALRKNYGN